MEILEKLQVGDQIGVYNYSPSRGGNAYIALVSKITPSGQVTLDNGKRFNSSGREIGKWIIDPTYLCPVEKAQELINKAKEIKQQLETKTQLYADSPEGRRRLVAQHSAHLVIEALQERGWFPDADGNMDALEFEIETKVLKYVEEYDPLSYQ